MQPRNETNISKIENETLASLGVNIGTNELFDPEKNRYVADGVGAAEKTKDGVGRNGREYEV